jgi:hypothetical protein
MSFIDLNIALHLVRSPNLAYWSREMNLPVNALRSSWKGV